MKKSLNIPDILTLNVGYAVHDADWNWENIRSPFSRIYLVTSGQAKVKKENETICLKQGHLYMIPAFTTHHDICTGHFEHYYLHLFENSDSGESIFEEWNFPSELEADSLCIDIFERLRVINPNLSLSHSNPKSYDTKPMLAEHIKRNLMRKLPVQMESRGIALQLFSRFLNHAKPKASIKDKRIRESIRYIKQHLDESIDTDFLASMACISKDHFIRLFKKSVGKTPIQYIAMLKIERAEVLLITSSMTVKAIASTLGFDDYSYFIRIFRNKLGITPRQYRDKYKNI